MATIPRLCHRFVAFRCFPLCVAQLGQAIMVPWPVVCRAGQINRVAGSVSVEANCVNRMDIIIVNRSSFLGQRAVRSGHEPVASTVSGPLCVVGTAVARGSAWELSIVKDSVWEIDVKDRTI